MTEKQVARKLRWLNFWEWVALAICILSVVSLIVGHNNPFTSPFTNPSVFSLLFSFALHLENQYEKHILIYHTHITKE